MYAPRIAESVESDIERIYENIATCSNDGVQPTILLSYRLMCPMCGKHTELHSANDFIDMVDEWEQHNCKA